MQPVVALITQYGLALVFANVLIEQIGLPVPAVPAAAGAPGFAGPGAEARMASGSGRSIP